MTSSCLHPPHSISLSIMDAASPIAINDARVLWSEIDDEIIALRLDDGKYFQMDEVGSKIWKRLSAGDQIEAIMAALYEAYDAPKEQINADVTQFLRKLKELGFIASPAR